MRSESDLRQQLTRIDGRGYPAYKDLAGDYRCKDFDLYLDHVQGDPFAAPSKVRVRVPMSVAQFPSELFENPARKLGLCDFLAREVARAIGGDGAAQTTSKGSERRESRGRGSRSGGGSGKSGLIRIDSGGQEVLERSAVVLGEDWVEARLEVGLPAAGRRILGRQAETLLLQRLPAVARAGLLWESLNERDAVEFVHCVENQESIRTRLAGLGLVAFVANGAVLPRESGASERPLRNEEVVPFVSPPQLELEIDVPNPLPGDEPRESLRGMGIATGVTLIVGGGYHGKSTLLRALERAVYPHIPGDGREHVVSRRDLVKVRAEDGRRVERVAIDPFIGVLPGGRSTRAFRSEDASGSTSQAANIVEAVEVDCTGLLLDEDTSATNFMVRDARMQALVDADFEPIIPFLERVKELHDRLGVSTVMVMGGCGDYFDVADRVIRLRDYRVEDVSEEARGIAKRLPSQRTNEARAPLTAPEPRIPIAKSFDASRGRRDVKIDARDRDTIGYGSDAIDMRAVEQLVSTSQARAVGYAILKASRELMGEGRELSRILDDLEAQLDAHGVDALDVRDSRSGRHPGNLARPRRYEIAAAINRLRSLRVQD